MTPIKDRIYRITKDEAQTTALLELVETYTRSLLGITIFGFTDITQVMPVVKEQFFRSGIVNGEAYSAAVNQTLSAAGFMEAIEQLRERALVHGIDVTQRTLKHNAKMKYAKSINK